MSRAVYGKYRQAELNISASFPRATGNPPIQTTPVKESEP